MCDLWISHSPNPPQDTGTWQWGSGANSAVRSPVISSQGFRWFRSEKWIHTNLGERLICQSTASSKTEVSIPCSVLTTFDPFCLYCFQISSVLCLKSPYSEQWIWDTHYKSGWKPGLDLTLKKQLWTGNIVHYGVSRVTSNSRHVDRKSTGAITEHCISRYCCVLDLCLTTDDAGHSLCAAAFRCKMLMNRCPHSFGHLVYDCQKIHCFSII